MSKITSKAGNIICISIAFTIISAVGSIIYLGCQKNPTPILSSLTLIGSFIGAFATLIAAYIASLLFNDWRKQHNKQVLAFEAKETFHLFHDQRDYLNSEIRRCKDIISDTCLDKRSWESVANDFECLFLKKFNKDTDHMSAFCFLSEGQLVHDLTTKYFISIQTLATYLGDKRALPYSEFTFLDKNSCHEFVNLLDIAYDKNHDVLNELKTHIFVLPNK